MSASRGWVTAVEQRVVTFLKLEVRPTHEVHTAPRARLSTSHSEQGVIGKALLSGPAVTLGQACVPVGSGVSSPMSTLCALQQRHDQPGP